MSNRVRFFRAYGTVMRVLLSYLWLGAWAKIFGRAWGDERRNRLHRRNAQRLKKTILQLKGLFIKMGQMLSIMSNFLPEDFRQEFETLQDAVPPHSFQAVESRFLEEFGKKPQEIFKSFSETPLASASLGQVHEAVLPDGTKVAVKVQYPEIDEVVKADLHILKRIFNLLHLFFRSYGLKDVYAEIASIFAEELDYLQEGKNLEVLRKNFVDEKDYLFPDVFWKWTTSKILTLQFMEGNKISILEDHRLAGINPRDVATKIIHAYCKQIFVDGIYHADPHPGNILVSTGEGTSFKIVWVDFGAVGRVSQKMRAGMTLFVEGLIKRDTRVLANAMREMGFVARPDSFEPFDELVNYFYDKLSNLKVENFRNLDLSQFNRLEDLLEIRKLNIRFKDLMTSFHVPKDWVLLERTMILVMGLCAHLDPQLNPIEIVLPYVEKFVLKDQTFAQVVGTMVKEVGLSYLQLPQEIHKTLKRLNEGRMVIGIQGQEDHSRKLFVLGHQILYGILGLGGLFLSAYLESVGLEAYRAEAFYGSCFFGVVLLISLVRNR